MIAIFKRELKAYFASPIGFVFLAAGFLFSGLYFYAYNLYAGATNLSALYSVMFSVILFLIPVLTMRLLSEEKRQKTDQLLLTSPVSCSGIVLGKFSAAAFVYFLCIASTLLDAVVLSFFTRVNVQLIIGNFLGLLFVGCALIGICLYLSSLTENQLIAAVSGFCVSILVILIDALEPLVGNELLRKAFSAVNFSTRYRPFTSGLLELRNVVFFVSVAALFLYFTIARLERRRQQ